MSRVAIVSPHLDDAILSAWLLLKRAQPVRVISCFAGVPAHGARGKWDARTGPGGSAVGIRRNEDLAALGLVNAEAIHLGCIDEQYRGRDEPPIPTLTGMLREQLADVDEVWIPAALGRHADHLAAREAAMAACTRTARRFLFADLPYAGQPAWSAEITGAPRDIAVQVLFRALRRPTPASACRDTLGEVAVSAGDACVERLTPAQSAQKWEAVSRYDSQLAALKLGRSHPLRRRRVLAYEVHWALGSSSDPRHSTHGSG